ncbi:MAG: hypothetical protein CVV64_14000 [Candidatus Wallbacteria bacterium HGW-Wallbacteria-1]|jgi:hypothetical protein|uniref:Uncharacterized protein n=1 Tax=Candidatus Wallbacteria bacterium HGW-Wallbacteria-1 TaxID=2013854 RepID=A0A2N1PMF7_9BACT|nr:MAG: hypothetical protein CVV64_14000 [Candidatus Wallbacteria bacterium HGW-Wallbacteria-1]
MMTLYLKELRQLFRSIVWLFALPLILIIISRGGQLDFVAGVFVVCAAMALSSDSFLSEGKGRFTFLCTLPVSIRKIYQAKFLAILSYMIPIWTCYLAWAVHTGGIKMKIAFMVVSGSLAMALSTMYDTMSRAMKAMNRGNSLKKKILSLSLTLLFVLLTLNIVTQGFIFQKIQANPLAPPTGIESFTDNTNLSIFLTISVLIALGYIWLSLDLTRERETSSSAMINIGEMEVKAGTRTFNIILISSLVIQFATAFVSSDFKGTVPVVFATLVIAALAFPYGAFHRHINHAGTWSLLCCNASNRAITGGFIYASIRQLTALAAVQSIYVLIFNTSALTAILTLHQGKLICGILFIICCMGISIISGTALFLRQQRRFSSFAAFTLGLTFIITAMPIIMPDWIIKMVEMGKGAVMDGPIEIAVIMICMLGLYGLNMGIMMHSSKKPLAENADSTAFPESRNRKAS